VVILDCPFLDYPRTENPKTHPSQKALRVGIPQEKPGLTQDAPRKDGAGGRGTGLKTGQYIKILRSGEWRVGATAPAEDCVGMFGLRLWHL